MNVQPPITFITVRAVFLVLVLGQSAAMASEPLPAELAAGVTRFALDTGDLPHAMALARQLKGGEADYLLARTLLGSGQVHEAESLLERVFSGNAHRGEAALELARLAESRADVESAGRWFQEAVRTGYGEVRQQALLGLADLERRKGRPDRAGQHLASMNDGYWAAVGYMNLAADFARDDLNPSRALVSLRVAMAMAAKERGSDRSVDLLDQLYLRAGYLSLSGQDYDKAVDFLEKVSLDRYYTPQALYLHGFVLSEKGNQRAAMQSWHRAKKFPLAFPGVADAWIGMGRGYDMAGYPGQAGEAWLAANAAYEGERVTLSKLAERVQSEGAYKALVEDARGTGSQWFLADNRTLTQPRLAYLLRFLESAEGQAAVTRLVRLDSLAHSLNSSRRDLDVFIGALDDGQPNRGDGQLADLKTWQNTLSAQLDKLRQRGLNPEQASRVERLERLMASASKRLESLPRLQATGKQLLASHLAEARQLRAEIAGLAARVSKARTMASAHLDTLVLQLVEAERQRMAHSLDKTEQQIAHLYEYLALQNIGEDAR